MSKTPIRAFQTIERADLPFYIGKCVHVVWAGRSCRWQLEKVEGELAHLITTHTRRKLVVNVDDLRKTRKHEEKSELD